MCYNHTFSLSESGIKSVPNLKRVRWACNACAGDLKDRESDMKSEIERLREFEPLSKTLKEKVRLLPLMCCLIVCGLCHTV